MQVRDFQRWSCTGSFAVHLKAASLNRVRLILSPLPGDRLTFFVLLITEKITFSTDLCQVDFPEHHAGRLLRTGAFIQCFLPDILHQFTTCSNSALNSTRSILTRDDHFAQVTFICRHS